MCSHLRAKCSFVRAATACLCASFSDTASGCKSSRRSCKGPCASLCAQQLHASFSAQVARARSVCWWSLSLCAGRLSKLLLQALYLNVSAQVLYASCSAPKAEAKLSYTSAGQSGIGHGFGAVLRKLEHKRNKEVLNAKRV